MQAQTQLFAVAQVDFRLRNGGFAAAQLRRRLFAQRGEDGFDVFASAECVGAKVGAFTGIVADVEAANADTILPAGLGIGDLVIAENAIAAEVLNAELALHASLAPDVDFSSSRIACLRLSLTRSCSSMAITLTVISSPTLHTSATLLT